MRIRARSRRPFPRWRPVPRASASAGNEAFVATALAHGPVLLATRAARAGVFGTPVALTDRGDAAAGAHVLAAYQRGDRLRLEVVR